MSSLLKVENLNKSFKALHILKGVNLEVNKGERHVIIGPNGAGKTTLFNCIYGTLPLSSGTVYLNGERIDNVPSYNRIKIGMGRTFQKNNLFNELTVAENVHLAIMGTKPYTLNGFKPISMYKDLDDECKALLTEWEMDDRSSVLVKELSYGEQRLLEIVLSLCTNPSIILLDEPTSGMSPSETGKFAKIIQKIPKDITLIMIEHDMEVVFSIADKITVLHHGTAIMTADPEDIRGDEMIQEIYFGGGALS